MNKEFWFDVRWQNSSFVCKEVHYGNLMDAYEACKRMFPGANIFARGNMNERESKTHAKLEVDIII